MYLSLPIPSTKHNKVSLQQCLDAFVKEEVMEKSDAWYAFLHQGLSIEYHHINHIMQELSLVQNPPEGDKTTFHFPSASRASYPSQAFLLQGPFHRQT